MEKILEEVVQKTNRLHKYYCDGCGEFLGESLECDDGYVSEYNRYGVTFNLPLDCDHSGYGKITCYTFDRNYCDKCLNDFVSKIHNSLMGFGFEID